MITVEGILSAKDIVGKACSQFKSLLAVSVDQNGDTRLICDGEPDDVVLMMDRISLWRDNYRKSMYKEKGGNK